MSANSVRALKLAPRAELPEDFPGILRRIADEVEAGKVTKFVAMYVEEGEYALLKPSSLFDSIVLSALLHDSCVQEFRE